MQPFRCRQPAPAGRGFVLLMALVLVLLAGVALAGIAGRSMSSALHTRTEVQELQRRWAVISLRTTLAGRIEELLEEAQRGQAKPARQGQPQSYDHPPLPEWRLHLTLVELAYELVLTDEQAKLNVHDLLEDHSTARLTRWLQRAVQGLPAGLTGGASVRVQPLQALGEDDRPQALPRLGAYGQLFPHATPQELIGASVGQGLVRDFTCWGNGQINLHRASERVLEERCDTILSERQKRELFEARKNDPYQALEELYKVISDLNSETQRQLEGRFTDQSNVYGLWIIAQDMQRPWYYLLITVGGQEPSQDQAEIAKPDAKPTQQYEFSW